MSASVRTCLWFAERAEEAVDFYTSLLPNSSLETVERPAPDAPPLMLHFTLAGAPYTALQAGPGPEHSPAASIAVVLDTQVQADALYDRLVEAGGTEVQCGWVTDAWGISWQVVPDGLHRALLGGDAEANRRAYVALQTMKKIDLAALKAAARGAEPAH